MSRRQAVWALLAVAVAVLATGAPVWVHGTTTSAVQAVVTVQATGSEVAPGVGAGGLVIAAAALALALGRRVGAILAAVVAALGGVLVTVSALGAASRATTVLASTAADRVGVGDVGDVVVGLWPWVAAALGLAAVLVAVGTVVWSRRWQGPTARHEVAPRDAGEQTSGGTVDAGEAWDALTRGEDPT
ncbi:Trp biosynthesis-associated membrane protein [Actinotalea sp. M2MS4P-6]|uniref:Trp biosynthesis-associated membrane protein n=1 Tax=Actinotalea sp. M2MS4P-6 TaxID=2983762 RepID=UPI0021E40F13|nr:Trp biosynthesis-associated membrane protein [Actinotalea sp. M2MS4P-6]MCV2394793.1 Trp biosynthesis-associated membrane protein [Actinotalea sp. M2MS4P-6]